MVNIDPKDVGIIVPMLFPIGLMLIGSILLGWGVAGDKVEPEFTFEATGRAADDEKAKRFIEGYRTSNSGRKPKLEETMSALKVSRAKAQRYHSKFAA